MTDYKRVKQNAMTEIKRVTVRMIGIFLFFIVASFQQIIADHPSVSFHTLGKDRIISEKADSIINSLPLIMVKGNKFTDADGNPILFRGMSISDPDKIYKEGHWQIEYFKKAKEWGAKIIRIPIHPASWREMTPPEYLRLLDSAAEWCTDLGMYIIIDWHSIGNIKTGLFQDSMYITSKYETFEFWRTIASHFSGNNTVAFYELFNEPTTYFGKLGRISWEEWKNFNEDLIHLIRAYDTETIPLVAGFDWAYDLSPLRLDPIEADNIGYVVHPYPNKRTQPWEPKWEENFGFAAETYPLLATEIGFVLGNYSMAENGEYGQAILKFLEDKGIGWLAWVFDPDWFPQMFESWDNYKPTEQGIFFKQVMSEKNN